MIFSSFISDVTGEAIQHLNYLPFGEPNRHLAVSSRTPIKIKYYCEQTYIDECGDDETQYSYFGARYYDSDLSVWLSVDPMADKYPSMSAYMYCAGNPVMLVDPNGMETIIPPTQDEYEQFGITPQAQQRFEAILHNIESFSENKEFMYAFSQTTGLNSDEIKGYLTYGSGPKADITYGSWANAAGPNNFYIGNDIINYLGSIDASENQGLATQSFGVAMVLIDELSHNGDMAYNQTETSTGTTINNPGKQNWSLSPTFHRGGDSQIFGFGIETSTFSTTSTDRKGRTTHAGQIDVLKPFTSISNNKYSNFPIVPAYDNNLIIYTGNKLLK